MTRVPPLVSQDWLLGRLGDSSLVVVDCRFDLADFAAARRRYLAGHIRGAAFLDLETDLSGPKTGGGRHPLPDAETYTRAARSAGISRDSVVVAYDQQMSGGGAHLWWLLRHFGHDEAGVLEGGLDAWRGPVSTGRESLPAGDFVARPRTDDVADAGDVLARLHDPGRRLIDARAPERYRGEVEPIDTRAGHIPGAVNLPHAGALPAPSELVEAPEELVVYCGSGVSACVVLLGLAVAGRRDAKLYPGSWSDWIERGLPGELGDGT
jgi:thiosulfate/3-mercaptopyruvate sulfurtransferase